jgi:hypothetical protein
VSADGASHEEDEVADDGFELGNMGICTGKAVDEQAAESSLNGIAHEEEEADDDEDDGDEDEE